MRIVKFALLASALFMSSPALAKNMEEYRGKYWDSGSWRVVRTLDAPGCRLIGVYSDGRSYFAITNDGNSDRLKVSFSAPEFSRIEPDKPFSAQIAFEFHGSVREHGVFQASAMNLFDRMWFVELKVPAEKFWNDFSRATAVGVGKSVGGPFVAMPLLRSAEAVRQFKTCVARALLSPTR